MTHVPGRANQAHLPAGLVDSGFEQGLVSGFLLILFSELGDKTFFIALLLALKQNKGIVFAGTFGALAVMTVISVKSRPPVTSIFDCVSPRSLPGADGWLPSQSVCYLRCCSLY